MEDSAFQNQRIVKRRLMEEGGAEVRRIHIVYFLSRGGCDEHPHLIRTHHLSRNGVRLRDIKRWMGELRGKKMPELFAWSYKRIYKTGYVWQDLVDDDLVTPISDNEYVLKGSEISSTTNNIGNEGQEASDRTHSSDGSTSVIVSKSSFEVEDSSTTSGSESSTLTDDSANNEQENNSDRVNQVSSDKPRSKKCNSSGIFRNLITCGGVDTSDSLVMMTNKRSKPFLNMCSSCSSVGVKNSTKEEDRLSVPSASYKPLYKPKCSQCRKRFKPEKLCAHMKSCNGMKAKGKDCDISVMSTATSNEDSVSVYLHAR